MINDLTRRSFLTRAGAGLSAVWLSAHWPTLVAAAQHAHQAAKSAASTKFHFFSPEQAVEIDAITARIIPTDETPGAHEAGVVYFIDRALATFEADKREAYHTGMQEIQQARMKLYPHSTSVATLTSAQQKALRAGQLYIQINSVKAPAPAGNLWGWILIAYETVGPDVPQQGHGFLPQYDMPESSEHGSTHPLKTDTDAR